MNVRVMVAIACLCLSACASAPQPEVNARYSVVFGIVSKPDQKPLVVDRITDMIPLNSDGSMPRIAARVEAPDAAPFLLSYVVYRRDTASGKYVQTETSPTWRIKSNPPPATAFIRPDFLDGVFLGKYRFEIFVNERLDSTLHFSVVPSGT
ncbi:MAG: hypothetical protein R3E77_16765 [Steroidobacteraceae bacterium]